MTVFRVWKAKLGDHSFRIEVDREPEGFYRFALSPNQTIQNFKKLGFELVSQEHEGSFKGLKEEVQLLGPLIHTLQKSSSLAAIVLKRGINKTVPPMWFAHIAVLILRRK